MYIHIKSESQRPNHQPMNTNEVFFYQWNQWHLSSTSPPSARQKLRKQKSCTEFCGERGAECVTWYRSSKISTVQKKTQRGSLTLPKHFMYGILCLPTFTMKKPTIDSNIYIYIHSKPIRAPVYTGTSPLRRRWNTHLFGWFKSWFYFYMKPKIVKILLMEKQVELLFRSWTLWWYFVHETIPT